MSNAPGGLGSLIAALLKILRAIFGGTKPAGATVSEPIIPPDNTTEPTRIVNSRVLLIVYDPVMDEITGQKLSQEMGWNRVDTLISGFTADILETSGRLARYRIVERIELNEFPAKKDGFRYDPDSYRAVLQGGAPHKPKMADYHAILTDLNILPCIENHEIDELWVFAFPHAGFYESIMGGAGAFWCNAPPLANTSQCGRKFVIMGFSYERGLGEMLESFGHRAESILAETFRRTSGNSNLYQRFTLYDKIAPGQAEVGTIHFAPNSEKEYDCNNPRKVLSRCDDWYNFPAFQDVVREVNAEDWGNGDMREHHKWWLDHLPRVAGRTSGIANNWWQYIMNPNLLNM